MQNIPKIVTERLRATSAPVTHPDADVLTAFAERSLTDRERATVFEHLARCRDCRDIVAFALPTIESAQTVITPTRGWLTWPALRWGFVAVGVVAIASFGIVQYQRQSRPTATVAREMNRFVATDSHSKAQAAAEAKPNSSPTENRQAEKPSSNDLLADTLAATSLTQLPAAKRKDRIDQPPIVHLPKNGVAIGGPASPVIANNYMMQAQSQQQAAVAKQQNADTTANLKVPSASQTVEVAAGAAELVTTQPSELNTEASNSSLFGGDDASQQLTRAKPAVNTGAATVGGAIPQKQTAATGVNGRNFSQLIAMAPGDLPSWGISSAGTLQRSFDHGTTWQDVNVTANLVPSRFANFARRAVNVNVDQKKADNADKSVPTPPASTLIFRAVIATGADVWAGGSGSLYHSLDAGNHWTQVTPSAAGATLTGDVIRLEFSDAQHGTVTTSTSEIWITTDDGQTWQKQ